MNRVYPIMLTVCIYMMVIAPFASFAQCTCSPGHPATPMVQYITLAPTDVATATVSFNKFDPSIGTLFCVSLVDTITAVSTTLAWNKASTRQRYKFDLVLNNDIEGPGGISATSSYDKIYGPDTLEAYMTPGYSKLYGPDSIYVNNIDSNGTSNTSPYLGSSGTADFTYNINGGLLSVLGSISYGDSIYTVYQGQFKLTYYWCPAVPLSTTIKDFTAVPNGSSILLQWDVTNQQYNTNYEIETSTDGKTFTSIGRTSSDPAATSATAKYQYQYNPDKTNVGKRWFRIKETDASGQVTYSSILVVSEDGSSTDEKDFISYQVFPNPAANSLVFQFNSNQTGRYLLELVNTAGQTIQQKAVTLTGTSQIRMDLNPQPVKGLYFLRAADLTRNQQYVSKVLIN